MTKNLSLGFSALLSSAAFLAAAPDAQACSCLEGFTEFAAPSDGAVDVPTNAKVWIGGAFFGSNGDPNQLNLVDGAGQPVDVVRSTMRGDMQLLAVLTPDEELDQGGSYTVLDGGGSVVTTFTVGFSSDVEIPAIPEEVGRQGHSDQRAPTPPGSCGFSDLVTLQVASEGLFVVANVAEANGLNTDGVQGIASQMAFTDQVEIGRAVCMFSWPDAEPNAATEVRLGTFDIAGNFSGWTDSAAVQIPQAGFDEDGNIAISTTCSSAGEVSPAAAALLLVGFAAVFARRTPFASRFASR